jgi:hypothetical protein
MWKFITEPSQRQELWTVVTERVKSLINAQQWESRHGGFCASKVLSSIQVHVNQVLRSLFSYRFLPSRVCYSLANKTICGAVFVI